MHIALPIAAISHLPECLFSLRCLTTSNALALVCTLELQPLKIKIFDVVSTINTPLWSREDRENGTWNSIRNTEGCLTAFSRNWEMKEKSSDSNPSYFCDTSNMLSFTSKHCPARFMPGSFHMRRGVGMYRDKAWFEVWQKLVRFFTLCLPVLDRVGAQCCIQLNSLVWSHETIFLGDHKSTTTMKRRRHKQSFSEMRQTNKSHDLRDHYACSRSRTSLASSPTQ